MSNTPNMESFWMPFTPNRQFKASPRLLVSAKGMFYTSHDDRQILDSSAGLWTVNAGHGRQEIVDAVAKQMAQLDYAPNFNLGHPIAFEFAERLGKLAPEGFDHVFFTNSGSESVDTGLKIAQAYHVANGEGRRTRLIGRERAYHGVNYGGISVGGLVYNRKTFSTLHGVDHISHTHGLEGNFFTKGQPPNGRDLAKEVDRLANLHGAETIAAVIVEPVAGSTGVLVPPIGYLEELRAACDRVGCLLIFDEVITGYGRLGTPFASQYFGVMPDIFLTAKGINNGCLPMGAVFASDKVYNAFMNGPTNLAELMHGYTCSGHPAACAAGMATMDIMEREGLYTRAKDISPKWEAAIHALKGTKNVVDIRNIGLIGAIEFSQRNGVAGARTYEIFTKCYEKGVLVRVTGDVMALSPPLIIEDSHIDQLFQTIKEVAESVD